MIRHLPTRWKPLAAVAVTAALVTPLLVLGGPAFARTGAAASQYQYGSSDGQYGSPDGQNGSGHAQKITICHLTHSKKHPGHTISISQRAWKGHSRHGDHLGPCTGTEQPLAKQHGKSGEAHGKSGETHGKSGEAHGKSGDQHGDNGDD
jgi:hypothetical protein